jgi:hypothetical protein
MARGGYQDATTQRTLRRIDGSRDPPVQYCARMTRARIAACLVALAVPVTTLGCGGAERPPARAAVEAHAAPDSAPEADVCNSRREIALVEPVAGDAAVASRYLLLRCDAERAEIAVSHDSPYRTSTGELAYAETVQSGSGAIELATFRRIWAASIARMKDRDCRAAPAGRDARITLRDAQSGVRVTCATTAGWHAIVLEIDRAASTAEAAPQEAWPTTTEFWRDELRYAK